MSEAFSRPRLLAQWNPTRGAWETGRHDLLSMHSELFLETWPVSGMTRDGSVYELPTPELPTAGSASSSLPTPVASDSERTSTTYPGGNSTLQGALLKTPTSQLAVNGGSQHPDKRRAGGHGPTLADEVEHLFPTPTVGNATGGNATRSGPRGEELLLPGIARELALLPTPAANDSGNTPENHLRKKPGRQVVTSLMVLVDYGLIRTGGRIAPPSSAGSKPPAA